MEVSFDVQLQPKDLFRFNMYQTYTGMQGVLSIVLGILGFVMAGLSVGKAEIPYTIMYIVVGLIFLFYIPVSLWLRSKHTLKANAVLAGKLHYEVSEKGIHVVQGKETGDLPWDAVYKLVSNKHQILIYTTRVNAYVVPREQIGDQYDGFCQVAGKVLEPFRLKLKK